MSYYRYQAGRGVVKDNKHIVSIEREQSFTPTQADAFVHYIIDALNERDKSVDFNDYYKSYMNK